MLAESIGTISMINYPYPTNFLGPLPAWPVNASCSAAIETNSTMSQRQYRWSSNVSHFDWSNILSLRDAARVYYDPYGNLSCLDISTSPYPQEVNSPAHCD